MSRWKPILQNENGSERGGRWSRPHRRRAEEGSPLRGKPRKGRGDFPGGAGTGLMSWVPLWFTPALGSARRSGGDVTCLGSHCCAFRWEKQKGPGHCVLCCPRPGAGPHAHASWGGLVQGVWHPWSPRPSFLVALPPCSCVALGGDSTSLFSVSSPVKWRPGSSRPLRKSSGLMRAGCHAQSQCSDVVLVVIIQLFAAQQRDNKMGPREGQ